MEVCPLCEASHHSECWIENGGCAVIGCEAVAQTPGQGRIVITEADLETQTTGSPTSAAPPTGSTRQGLGTKFAVPQVGKVLIITAVVLVALAIAAAFYLRNATQGEEGPRIDFGDPASKSAPE